MSKQRAEHTIRLIGLLLLAFLSVTTSNAATFTKMWDEDTYCILKMKGTIEQGDYEKLLDLIVTPDIQKKNPSTPKEDLVGSGFSKIDPRGHNGDFRNRRLCLNSSGGSFSEALKIASIVAKGLGTVVKKNRQCLSACALIFMAGKHNTGEDGYMALDRHIHGRALLGFHAPSLDLNIDFLIPELINAAYAVALSNSSAILANRKLLELRDSLLIEVLGTPPKDMFYIDTPGKAAKWKIDVFGIPIPKRISQQHIALVCAAANLWEGENSLGAAISLNTNEIGSSDAKGGLKRIGNVVTGTRVRYPTEGEGTCSVSIDLTKVNKSMQIFGELGVIKLNDERRFMELRPIYFYWHNAKFYDIIKSRYSSKAGKLTLHSSGICRKIKNQKITFQQNCSMTNVIDLFGVKYIEYTWKNNKHAHVIETVDSIKFEKSKVSRASTISESLQKLFPERGSPKEEYGDCLSLPGKLNFFCYEQKSSETEIDPKKISLN
ncbi:hypothetical protein [uncultured Cohaesibacter sp.]|uniref:hypothetical protein n=1 Tax=uncultured Cohaesibacter sp. TaxID=1002546 RepID=UPI0029C66691|nr:hypothetical protein [uncultured Cohaesibacter sp.]